MNVAVVEGDTVYQDLIKAKLIENDWDIDFFKETNSFLKQFQEYDVVIVDEETSGREIIKEVSSKCKALFSLISSNPNKFSKDDISDEQISALIDKAVPEKIVEWLKYADAKLRISEYMKTENANYNSIAYRSDSRVRVLIIDDQKYCSNVIKNVIELVSDDFLVEIEEDGVSALTAVEKFKPQIVLLDLDIPKIDGIEVCQLLKHNPKTTAIDILIISGFDQEGLEEMAKEAGADMFLKKSSKRLISEIEQFIKVSTAKIKRQRNG